jgi:YD repeat-containing protein
VVNDPQAHCLRRAANSASNIVADLVYDAAGNGVSERRGNLGRIRFKMETFRDATGAHATVTKKWEYRYDERGQLKTVYLDGILTYDAVYDKNGNVKQYTTAPGGPTTTCSYDDQDRLKSCGALTFTYHDNGEVKTKFSQGTTWTYHYDALGRLRQAKNASTTYDYVVDGEGRRIAKKVNGTITKRWLYGRGLSPIAELNAAGSVVAR